jgi:hypothetical protein
MPAPAAPAVPPGPHLPLPHERDEAAGHVAPGPDPVIRQAQRDIDAGLVDTDLRATPGLDAQRREVLLAGRTDEVGPADPLPPPGPPPGPGT